MRKNAQHVTMAWLSRHEANEKTIRTDGYKVWSYALPIAERIAYLTQKGDVVQIAIVLDEGPTQTTKGHVSACAQAASTAGYQVIRSGNVTRAADRLRQLLDTPEWTAADAATRLGAPGAIESLING